MDRKVYISDGVVTLVEYVPSLDDENNYQCWLDEETAAGYNGRMTLTFEEFVARPTRNRFKATVVCEATGEPVGTVFMSPEGCLPDLAIMMYAPYRGRGMGTRAFELALEYCFDAFDLDRMYAGCYPHNDKSKRMLEKCGFVPNPDGNVEEEHYITGEKIIQQDNVKYNIKKLELTHGEWSCRVAPGLGMNVLSLKHGDHRIMRYFASDNDVMADPVLYGTPVLLPANRTKGAEFEFEGKKYHLELNEPQRGNHLHGKLYTCKFEVDEVGEDYVISHVTNKGELYPFPFTLRFYDKLSDNGFERKAVLTNDGDGRMPFTLAFHTTFEEPEDFAVDIGEHFEWDENYIPTGVMLPLDEYESSFGAGACSKGKEISGYYTSTGNVARVGGYRFTVSENFDEWVFYNGNSNEGYLCIEPQCGMTNGLNTAGRCHVLERGQSEEFTISISKIL